MLLIEFQGNENFCIVGKILMRDLILPLKEDETINRYVYGLFNVWTLI